MKTLVIPDAHLKPYVFEGAESIMHRTDCEQLVCIGDIVDDFGHQADVDLYEETLNRAISLAKRYPDSLWCLGNHDVAYLYEQYDHPGYSEEAASSVKSKLDTLKCSLSSPTNMAIIHRIDNVLFSHAGLVREFVETWCKNDMDDVDRVIKAINDFGIGQLREGISPIWARPQVSDLNLELYPADMMQVVGHTPVSSVVCCGNLITTDTFSTYRDGTKYGNEEFCWIDTRTSEWGVYSS